MSLPSPAAVTAEMRSVRRRMEEKKRFIFLGLRHKAREVGK